MTTPKRASSASKPVVAMRVSASVQSSGNVAKKAVKKAIKKSPRFKSPLALKREEAAKRQQRINARAKTKAATDRKVGPEPIATDPADEAARAAIDRQRQRAAAVTPTAKSKSAPSARIKRTAVERLDDPPPATGMALIERVTQAVERELSQIEIIIGGHHVKPHQRTEAERRARTLASLARTLTEVRKLRADEEKSKPEDDDAVPRDLDEFRRTLSRRLEQMVRARADVSAGGDEPG